MAFRGGRKLAALLLAIYWPTLFVLAHIPIPRTIENAGVSDKTLHFLAYLVLVFLLWISLYPDRKVRWRKVAAWLVLSGLMVYGGIDELLQSYVGRSCDIRDLIANLAGILTGLVLLSFLRARAAAVVVSGVVIFGLSNVARTRLADLLPVVNSVFHLLSYGVFTLLWTRYMETFKSPRRQGLRWLLVAVAPSAGLLLVVKSFSAITGRGWQMQEVILAAVGSAGAAGAVFIGSLAGRGRSKTQGAGPSRREG